MKRSTNNVKMVVANSYDMSKVDDIAELCGAEKFYAEQNISDGTGLIKVSFDDYYKRDRFVQLITKVVDIVKNED